MWVSLFEHFQSLDQWDWFVLALLLLLFEVFINAAFFMWFAISAAVVGGVVLVIPSITWQSQLSLFIVNMLISLLFWRVYCRSKKRAEAEYDLKLNRCGQACIGHDFLLDKPIEKGLGQLIINDIEWGVRGADCAGGRYVTVLSVEGKVLTVVLTEKMKG